MAFSMYLTDLLSRKFFLEDIAYSPILTGAYLGLVTTQSPYGWWYEVAPYYGYARVPFAYSIMPSPNDYIYNTADSPPITFPDPSGSWGRVRGLALYDTSTAGTGNELFTFIWNSGPPNWTTIPYYDITTGMQLTIPRGYAILNVQGNGGTTGYTLESGGVAPEFNKIILEWIFNINSVPYTTPILYDVAIGYGASINLNNWGRWTGNWNECSAGDYRRVPMAITDWKQNTSGIQNKYEIAFTDKAEENWGRIEDIVLYIHDRTPNVPVFWGHLATHTNVYTGNMFSIGAERIKIYWEGDTITV
jgi:hypothetical protein